MALDGGYTALLIAGYYYFFAAYQDHQVAALTPFFAAGMLTIVLLLANKVILRHSAERTNTTKFTYWSYWWISLGLYVLFMWAAEAIAARGLWQ